MGQPHSVEDHLGLKVEDYDREIRRLVPHYDEMVSEGMSVLRRIVAPDARILDLGCGTGRMAAAIVAAMPRASVTLLDVDPKMLDQARVRFQARSADEARVSFALGSFFDPLPAADAIVASLSLHHIQDLAEKARVYRAALDALPAGGLFLVLDASVADEPRLSASAFDRWAEWMGAHGIEEAAARQHFADWAREERYVSIADELQALRAAGFARPECFWRKGPIAAYGGIRGA
ncbi:MAG: class I SAM-dependent methyltransferase [Polyangiaceae bacterium]